MDEQQRLVEGYPKGAIERHRREFPGREKSDRCTLVDGAVLVQSPHDNAVQLAPARTSSAYLPNGRYYICAMNTTVRKRLSAEKRRQRVLAAALAGFARAGYGGVSMHEIAAEAGVTKPVLYDHFSSKDRLFVAVLESIRDELLARGAAVATRPDDAQGRFRAAVEAFFLFAKAKPDAMRVLLITPQLDTDAGLLARRVQAGATAGIASLLKSYFRTNNPALLTVAAEFVKHGMHAVAEWGMEHPEMTGRELADVVVQLVWVGLEGGQATKLKNGE